MPQVVLPALFAGGAAGLGGAIAAGAGITLAAVLTPAAIAFTSTLVIGGINSLLYKQPKNDYATLIGGGGQNITIRQPAPPRQLVYGQARVGGAIFYRETTGNNKLLHIMVAYAGHEIEAYTPNFYFGTDIIDPFNYYLSDSRLIGPNYTNLNINFEPYNLAGGWIVRGTNSSINFRKIFGSEQASFEISGSVGINDGIYRRLVTKENDIQEDRIRVERIDNQYMAAEVGAGIGMQLQAIWIVGKTGTSGQSAQDLTEISSDWKPGYRARGIAYCWYQLAWNPRLFPQGLENLGCVLKGKKVYDPRTSTTVWTQNSALIVADFLCDDDFGFRYTYADHINEAALIVAANVCDETVNLADGSTEKRYECNGVHYSGQSREETINALLASMAGSRAWVNGEWYIYAGAHTTSIYTITDDDLRGDGIKSVSTGYPHNVRFNAVKGTYMEAEQDYQTYDFKFQESDTFEAEDGSTQLWHDVEYPFTTSGTMAQRLARIELLRNRQMIRVKLECKFTVLEIIPGEVVKLTNSIYGWTEKEFLVTEVTLNFSGDNPGVDLSLQETDSTIFDWNTSLEQTVDPAPNTNLPEPWNIVPPSSIEVTDEARIQQDGSEILVMIVTWDQGADATGIEWIVRWRESVSNDIQYSTQRTSYPRIQIAPVKQGSFYDISIAAINSNNAISEYSENITYEVIGDITPPPDVDSFEVYELPNGVRRIVIKYTDPPIDLSGFEIRYEVGQTSDWDNLTLWRTIPAIPLTNGIFYREYNAPVAAGDYRFAIKAIDGSLNYSVDAVFVDVTLSAIASDFSDEFDFKELGWPGTKTNCRVDSATGDLVPSNTYTWGTPGLTWGSAGSWAGLPVSQYTYEHPEVDMGSDVTFTPLIRYNTTAGTLIIEEKHKTASGSYTAFAAISGDITFRYIIFRIRATV